MIIRSPFPDLDIPGTTLTGLLFGDEPSDAPALIDPAGRVTTRRQLDERVRRIAAGLHARGTGRGSVVGLFAPNSPEWIAAFHGILRANAVVTSANVLYTATELAHQLVDSGASLLVTTAGLLDVATAAAEKAGIAEVLTLDDAPGHRRIDTLPGAAPPLLTGPGDTAVLPYSSGTTGPAKGVVLTHRNLVANVLQFSRMGRTTESTVLLAVLPLFHIYGMTVLMNHALHRRVPLVTMPRFDLTGMLRLIEKHRITKLYIAPPTAVLLAKSPLVDDADLSSVELVFSGAAPLDGELARSVARRLDCEVVQGYGMTEMSPVSHAVPEGTTMDPASVGVALPNVECRLVDPASGADAERGELWVRGPNVMSGYLDNPEATAATLDAEGWLHTGDVATVTADGVFSIVDRVKELIKYKGYQVPPAELEALLLTHPGIDDAAVVGVLDDDGEEIPKAFVVRRPGAALDAAEVMDYVAARIAPHKKVRRVEFLDAIPKSASGKILRTVLRAAEGPGPGIVGS
ncbi:4-coumarate--CoA ligase family protein [Amycolatopsis endophytica]|uniref:Acyl-CoA synthetase (AMP-forming)/AMP-acid ligase II n=1 Tax=Amycolatopsis endophytica TaxID=860233 RepID=A0A853BCK0_9PSEU|nr:AMP-binding protein [Amycolatopsis endophytica]NYI93128.1 acyl-CoA synthetase (AMP-forming)/AMP-acid ligase II [Amycolatopsis endophytica]